MATTYEAFGQKVRCRTKRRYIVVRQSWLPYTGEVKVAVTLRTDNLDTARKERRKDPEYFVIVDTREAS